MEMESSERIISKDDVIAKLKDDGDFDKLRLKTIRKLKENEELRKNIITMVKESAALNRADAENIKPRQLSDVIFEEIRDKVMSQISDRLWEIIRSGDGMKNEIAETVQSVYNKLLNPEGKEGEPSIRDGKQILMESDNNALHTTSVCENSVLVNDEPKEPPGFTVSSNGKNNTQDVQQKGGTSSMSNGGPGEEQREKSIQSVDDSQLDDADLGPPPGFSVVLEHKKPEEGSDDDPDVPPGFG